MKQLHYFSGITLSLFIGLHLVNHLLILHSPGAHIRFMNRARKLYRHPVVENFILLAAAVQVFSGPWLVVAKWTDADDFFDWVQMISGLYLALFLVVHILAVMRGRHRLHMDTNLYYGAGVMNMWPHKLVFIPYYTLAMLSFFSHVAAIHRAQMVKYVSAPAAEKQGLAILFLGILLTAIIIIKMSHLKMGGPAKPVKQDAV